MVGGDYGQGRRKRDWSAWWRPYVEDTVQETRPARLSADAFAVTLEGRWQDGLALRSHAPAASVVPPYHRPQDSENAPAVTPHADKARVVARKFTPFPGIHLSGRADCSWSEMLTWSRMQPDCKVTAETLAGVCTRTSSWKAAGRKT